LLAAALLVSACAAGLHGQHFHKAHVDYRIGRLDPAWQRERMRGMDLMFHRRQQGSIGVHATCQGYEDVPPSALLGHLLFGTSARQPLIEEESVTLDGRAARHTRLDAELDGAPVRIEIFMLIRSPCVFDLSYVSDRQARGRADFLHFVREFAVEAVRGG
jgi:hypothetical protein